MLFLLLRTNWVCLALNLSIYAIDLTSFIIAALNIDIIIRCFYFWEDIRIFTSYLLAIRIRSLSGSGGDGGAISIFLEGLSVSSLLK